MMVLEISLAAVVSFFTTMLLLVVYSILDLRDRKVENELILASGFVGVVVTILTGHLATNIILHTTAVFLTIPLVYVLLLIGSIGGADAKALCIIALVSPGIEFGDWNQPILEVIIGLGGELLIMLVGGYLLWRAIRKLEHATPPLLPFLLVGYLLVQIFALF